MEFNQNEIWELADMFQILSSETRLRLLIQLQSGEKSVSEISEILNMNISAISHQLKELKQHKIITKKKDGQKIYYSLSDPHILNILKTGIEHIKGEHCHDSY